MELLEAGRGVLWAQRLQHDADAARIEAVDPDLAREFIRVRSALRESARESTWERPGRDPDIDRAVALSHRWDAVLDAVRAHPQLRGFLRPATAHELLAALPDGPVVVLNPTAWRSDALVIDRGAITVVPLELDPAELGELVLRHFDAMAADGPDGEATVLEVLDRLWESVVAPVAAVVSPTGARRIWWCPTGMLGLLPVHAAQPRVPTALSRAWLDVVPSYAPTLTSLGRANRRPPATTDPTVLGVALPETPGAPALPYVSREVQALRGLHGPRWSELSGEQATVARVAAALDEHDWVHFGCHGVQELGDPSTAGLLLYDGKLDVSALLDRRIRQELIVLSACRTGLGGLVNVDEAITLASALHHGGCPHVVATLWNVHDAVAMRVAVAFHEELRGPGRGEARNAATALHRTVRRLRDQRPDHPRAWVSFVHVGG